MAKKVNKTNNHGTTDAALLEAVASVAVVTEVNWVYDGPEYDKGIEIHETRDMIRPRDFSPEEVAEFVANYPKYSTWWKPVEQ